MDTKFIPPQKPFLYKTKNIIFVIFSFENQNASVYAKDMLFYMLEHKILNKNQKK